MLLYEMNNDEQLVSYLLTYFTLPGYLVSTVYFCTHFQCVKNNEQGLHNISYIVHK